jgi:hypothetical protein
MTRVGWLRRVGDARVALGAFVAVQIVAIPLLLSWGHKWWFWADDWDFLAARTGGDFGDLFRSHYQHWTTLPVVAYRLLWWIFGIRTYVPYQLLVIVLHLAAAALLRVVMVRVGVRPWMATLAAGVFVFFGAGAENILVAFQITFVGSLVFGLGQLLLADHDGPVNRRDWLALGSGLLGLMCSGVGISMTIVVGIAMLLRRGWRIALLQTAPLAVAYGLWWQLSPKGLAASRYKSQTPVQVLKFVGIGIGTIFGRLTQVPFVGLALAAIAIVGLFLAIRRDGVGRLRRGYAVPLALLIGAVLFLFVTGIVRSGQPALFAAQHNIGPGRARQSRYVYIVVAMALPALAIAADAIARRWKLLTIPIALVLLAGLPGNIHDLRIYANESSVARDRTRTQILTAPRVPLARQLPKDTSPAPFRGLTLGWLVASVPSGRIPPPPHLTAKGLATETLALGVRRSFFGNNRPCFPLTAPMTRPLYLFRSFTLKRGAAFMRYVTPAGVESRRAPFPAKTSIVGASKVPLDIMIEPAQAGTMLCI